MKIVSASYLIVPILTPVDPFFASVSLLLRGTGTATTPGQVATRTINDDSSNNTISVLGDTILSPVIKTSGDYGIKFDGSGDRLQIPDNARFDLSSGPFEIEAWFYCNQIDSNWQTIISKGSFGTNFSWHLAVRNNAVRTVTSNGGVSFLSSATISAKTWHRVSLVGDGTNMYHYFNGVLIGTRNSTLTNATANIAVGCVNWNSPSEYFNGYIDDLRVTKGASTSLLLNGTGTGIEKTILDSSMNNNPIQIIGDAFLSSAVKKYGDYSMSFDGTGDRLTLYDDETFNLSGVASTIEMWFYCNSIDATEQMLISKHTNGSGLSWTLAVTSTYCRTVTNGGTITLTSNTTITAGVWHHIALVADGTTLKHFLNGTQIGTINATLSNESPMRVVVGANSWNSPDRHFNGYIDDLRITKGVARYTANFTPPTAELPASA